MFQTEYLPFHIFVRNYFLKEYPSLTFFAVLILVHVFYLHFHSSNMNNSQLTIMKTTRNCKSRCSEKMDMKFNDSILEQTSRFSCSFSRLCLI